MHELGIVFHIADMVTKIAEENQAAKVHSVTLEIGEVSAIIPHYLEDCWNWNANRTPLLQGCKLIVQTIPAVTFCEACGKTYDTVPQGKICPHCGSSQTYLLTGNEVQLQQIAVE